MKRRPFPRPPRAGPPARRGRLLALAVAVIAALSVGAGVGSAAPTVPAAATASQVFPPSAHMFGRSYAEWSGAWWQFTLAIPTGPTPAIPSCRPSGDKHVSFLVGIFSPTGQLDCTLPKGAALFLPVLNVDCSSVEAPPFFGGMTEAGQRACATGLMNTATPASIAATVDGAPVVSILRYRVVSPQFSFGPLPFPNGLGVPGGLSGTAVADGVYLMIKSLPVGSHTVTIDGTFPPPLDFTIHTTINITVLPR